MSQRTAGNHWLIYTADTGAVLTVDQVEKDKSAIWWLSGIARGDICALLEEDLRACASRTDLLVLVLKDVTDISSECLKMLVRLQKEAMDPHNGELRLADAKGNVAEKLIQLRLHLVLNITQEKLEQPKTDRPATNISVAQPVQPSVPTGYEAMQEPPLPVVPQTDPVFFPIQEEAKMKETMWMMISHSDSKLYPGTKEEELIGRMPECGVCLEMPSISRKHAKIFRKEDQWWVEDLGSTFGTWLNDQQLLPNVPVLLTQYTNVLRLSRFHYLLVLKPYCALIQQDEAPSGIAGRLVHETTGEFLSMTSSKLTLGRKFAPDDQRVMHTKIISSRHAEITRKQDAFYLTDLHSTNGTYLNNNLLTPDVSVMLTDGDHIRLGSEERGETYCWIEGKGELPDET